MIAVGAVIRNPRGELLLVRRGRPPRLGEWSIPGGKVELGETVREAILREVREETGLSIDVLGLIEVVDSITRRPEGVVEQHYVLLDYAARSDGIGLVPGDDVTEVRWTSGPELEEIEMWPETKRIISLAERFF